MRDDAMDDRIDSLSSLIHTRINSAVEAALDRQTAKTWEALVLLAKAEVKEAVPLVMRQQLDAALPVALADRLHNGGLLRGMVKAELHQATRYGYLDHDFLDDSPSGSPSQSEPSATAPDMEREIESAVNGAFVAAIKDLANPDRTIREEARHTIDTLSRVPR